MPLAGYEYDIFISYRHNDNLDGWVTDFVQNIEKELRSTIKETLTIYFDKNPHDGLLETHHVDKSLEGKLKCLIFIPIISQTYCDPKSFAWQHEFCAFNKLSKDDPFGRDIKLSNGNVASRILPIKIHDIDAEDKAAFENETGGVLRAIEFKFNSPGVNRSLTPSDNPDKNQNKTLYRDQINKVANAVKEIISALKNPVAQAPRATNNEQIVTRPTRNRKPLIGAVALALLIMAGYFLYQQLTANNNQLTSQDKSIAVLPFVDMSPAKDQEWFSDGLTEELLNSLARLPELKLIARTSSFAFKGKNIPVNKIADSLGVAYVLEGSVRKDGNQLRITAQLIQADKGTHIWSKTYDRTLDDVFAIQQNIAESIAGTLNILLDDEKKADMFSSGTNNVEAYEEYLKGSALYMKAHGSGALDSILYKANIHFESAIALDKEFAAPYLKHQDFYSHYFIHHTDIRKYLGKDTSEQQIYRQIVNDLDAAIGLEKNPAQRLIYQAERIMLSSDWSQWPALIKKLNENDAVHNVTFPGGFFEGLLLITNPEITLQLMQERLRNDPFNKTASMYLGFSLIRLNKLDSAEKVFEQNQISLFKYLLELRRGNFEQALEIYTSKGLPENLSDYTLLTLLTGKYEGTLQDIHRYINNEKLLLNGTVFYNALGEYEKADSVARVYDAKFLGPSSIADFLTDKPLYFRLSATPNLTARLREAGIDPDQYEKENYHQFKVVRLPSR